MKKLKGILSKVLHIKTSDITESTSPDTVPTWDSFNGLMLVSELETQYGVKFTMQEVTSVRCVGDIREALERHGVSLEL